MKKSLLYIATLVIAAFNAFSQADAQTTSNSLIQTLGTQDFCEKVYDINAETLKYLGDKPAIVDFYADWCGPCRALSPTLQKIAEKYKGKVIVYKVNVDNAREVAQAFGISSIPAILYIPLKGTPRMTIGGRDQAKFEAEIKAYLF